MLKATYEHLVHVESFKNIDLYQQGLYFLKFYIVHQGELATPYNYFEGQTQKKSQWTPANIQEDSNCFQTKTFMIRFQEEEVEIDESCVFKIQVPASPSYECEFKLVCELMCADIQKIGGPPSDEQLFRSVATFEATIKNSFRGVHEYVPIMFDNHHFCLVNCTIHSVLQDFKFQLSQLQVNLNQDRNKFNVKGKVLIQPKSFTEFLHKQTQKFSKSQEFFDYYVGQLRETSENLQKAVAKICGQLKLFDDLQKLPTIPKFSYIQYKESSILITDPAQQRKQNGNQLLLADVLNLSNIKDQNLLGNLIENDINQFASVVFALFNILIGLIQKNSKEYRKILQREYQDKIKDKWGETYIREIIKSESFSIGNLSQKQHESIAEQLRKKPQILESLVDVVDQGLFPDNKFQPVLFEEVYQKQPQSGIASKAVHIIVLVHGFQGTAMDMRLIRNNLQLQYPNHHYLCSRANEDMTDCSIAEMGAALAQEVRQYVSEYIKTTNFKLTFIGHSMGGVITRAALPHLAEFKLNMFTFVSLSSPHVGYGYNNSLLIDAGLWFLKRMRKSISLQQLAMTDAENIEETYLYSLSKQQGLNWFQNIVLASSAQDSYVPFESARIQKSFEKTDQNSKKYEKMVDNLMNGLRATQISRLDVNFVLHENRTLDNMIGRTAHIMFLENNSFLRMLVTCTDGIFE